MRFLDLIFYPDLFPLHLAIVFLFGAMMGSFFNVCIYRLPHGQSVNRPRRSFCPSCGTMIAWYDNVPIVSYLNLGGLCRHCGCRISPRYWLVELLTALLFSAVFWVHGYSVATPMFLVLTAILIISTFTDLDHWIIPDSISLGGTALGIVGAAAVSALAAMGTGQGRGADLARALYVAPPFEQMGAWGIAANSLAGAAFGYLLLWTVGVAGAFVFRKEAMGMGDMKLFACIGAFFGWQGCLVVLALASFVGATIGLSLIAAQWIVARVYPAASSIIAASAGPSASGEAQAVATLPDAPVSDSAPKPPAPRPRGRQLHHLPFGPYIAIAGYIVALFYRPMMKWIMHQLFFADFFGGR
jgi:leader peptidase (prepilin peptidase)/N-methyltransferase